MSAWLVMSALGFYPVNPASGQYDLTSPWIDEAEINLENGHMFRIFTEKQSSDSRIVNQVLLNGKALDKMLITHDQIMQGGTLKFVLGKE
jgi:putative alpha-1,2-mannosidase